MNELTKRLIPSPSISQMLFQYDPPPTTGWKQALKDSIELVDLIEKVDEIGLLDTRETEQLLRTVEHSLKKRLGLEVSDTQG